MGPRGVVVAVVVLALCLCTCVNAYGAKSSDPVVTYDLLVQYYMYCQASFCSAEQGLANWTCDWCHFRPVPAIRNITIFNTPGAGMGKIYGYVGVSDDFILVAFRGSETTANWLLDFEFTERKYPNVTSAKVHDGFYKGYLQVAPVITPTVLALHALYPKLPIISTGHSLGAALSLLNALGLIEAGLPNVQVWNFGQPRVGNDAFANYADKTVDIVYRTVNKHDIVPHIPPIDVGYYHVKTEVWFPTNATTFVICNSSGEDPSCSDSVPLYKLNGSDHVSYLGYGKGGLHPPGGGCECDGC